MRFRNRLISSAVAAALGTGAPVLVLAQSADQAAQTQSAKPAPPAQLEEIVVTGIRASLENAQELKKNSDTIQDSIIAEDIGKLPDVTAVEALQRITGVQIGRDLGEGGGTVTIGGSAVNSGIEIRGLPQVETTLNGREVFSASGSRVLNFEDIPSSLLAGIDVYKDPTPDLLEGGIGGTVDLRTRKPFDFKGLELEGSAAERYGDLVSAARPEFSALASDRWQTAIGEVGGLLSFGYSERAYREDGVTSNAVATSKTIVPGQTSILIPGVYDTMFEGLRKRIGVDGVLQFQPTDTLRTYIEASSQELSSKQNQYTFNSSPSAASAIPGTATFFPGTTDVSQVSYANAPVNSIGAYRALVDVNRQLAVNAKWTPGQFTLIGDASFATGTESLNNPAVVIGSIAPTLTQTAWVSGVTNSQVTGVDLTNLASYGIPGTSSYMYQTVQHFRGEEKAFRLDGQYAFQSAFFNSVSGGLRYADRAAHFNQATMFGSWTAAEIQANSGWFGIMPGAPYFSKTESGAVQPVFTVFNPTQLRYNLAAVENAIGAAPAVDNGQQDYIANEYNYSAFVRADFGWDAAIPIDGNIGVRMVRHEDFLTGEAKVNGVFQPDYFSSGTSDPLPSLNLRFKLRDDLQARFAASKVVSYPDFSQIRPSITLLPISGIATGGNPNLKPTKANQVDGSLEWYFATASSVTWDVFYKKLTNFILSETAPNAFTQGGVSYNLTGAINGPSGTIRGTEIAYQQFLDFLPGWWSGIGYQVNYTYVDAQAPTAVAGTTTTLPGLSKNNFNLIGIYEKGPFSFRAAYTWRSQFYTTIYAGSTAQLATNPIFTKQFGWLDASFTYDLTNQWSMYAQGSNILRTRLSTFYGTQTLPDARTIDDRQALLGVRFKFN
jgi:iron complex outermembrane recepter protein